MRLDTLHSLIAVTTVCMFFTAVTGAVTGRSLAVTGQDRRLQQHRLHRTHARACMHTYITQLSTCAHVRRPALGPGNVCCSAAMPALTRQALPREQRPAVFAAPAAGAVTAGRVRG